ncbi:hypothetical protein [Vibrio owensii]|uniref:hypothetical protein n=1 Tax=Vibrio owensii TaxID=696485 RepID=UPI00390B394C
MHPLQNGSQVTERPADKPVSGLPGYFTESGENNVPSYPGATWFNNNIDEFKNALELAGVSFDPSSNGNLAKAIATSGHVVSVDVLKTLNYPSGSAVRVKERMSYEFLVEDSGSGNGYDSIPLNNGKFANLIPVSLIDSYAFGCDGSDDTFAINRAVQYSSENKVAIVITKQPVLQTPYDPYCYLRIPNGATLLGLNDGNGGSVINIAPTANREFGLTLNDLNSLTLPAPALPADSITLKNLTVIIQDTGFDVDIAVPIVASQFHCEYSRLKSKGSKRHGFLIARTWFSSIDKLFAFENKGNGITIGKHPDITGFSDAAVNGYNMNELTANSNNLDETWVEDVQEEIGYGVGLWGTVFNLKLTSLKTELNKGPGLQDMSDYGNWSSDSHYTEANGSHGLYIANASSSGKTWQISNLQLQQNESVRIKPDSLTRGKIGISFAVGGNNIDVSGVDGKTVKVDDKNTSFTMRQALASLIVDYDVIYQQEGNLNTFDNTLFFIGNTVSDFSFNYQIVFVPTVTTTSTDTIDTNLYVNGVGQGTTQFAGPFTAYEEVVIKSFSGNPGIHYENRQVASYAESCPGIWQVRAKKF